MSPAGSFSCMLSTFLMLWIVFFSHLGWSNAELARCTYNESKTPWAAATQLDPERHQGTQHGPRHGPEALYIHLLVYPGSRATHNAVIFL